MPLHSFMHLEETETVFFPVLLGMAGAQAGGVDSYYTNGQEAGLTLTLWQKDGFCEFRGPPSGPIACSSVIQGCLLLGK